MGGLQRVTALDGDFDRLDHIDLPRGLRGVQTRPQSFSLDEFGGDEMQRAGHGIDGADLVYRNDVRVIERGSGAGLLLKTSHAVSFLGKLFEQDFDSEFAAQPRVFSQVNLAHSARAELAKNTIVRNRLSDHTRSALLRKSRIEDRGSRIEDRHKPDGATLDLRSSDLRPSVSNDGLFL